MREAIPLVELASRWCRATHGALRDPEVLSRVALTGTQARAVAFVARVPGSRQQRFVDGTGMDKAQVARIFKGLADRGLVERRADAEDGRASRLFLTADGEAVAQVLLAHRRRVSDAMAAHLTEAELGVLTALLDKTMAGLEGRRPSARAGEGP